MVFYHQFTTDAVWIDDKIVDISELTKSSGKEWSTFVEFDSSTAQLWVITLSYNDTTISFYNITGGKLERNPITIELSDKVRLFVKVSGNKALFRIDTDVHGQDYMIVDFLTGKTQKISLTGLNLESTWRVLPLLGFYDDKIFFQDGFYSITEQKKHEYKLHLRNPRLIPADHKIIGLNDEDNIVLYDIESEKSITTPIRRNKKGYAKYNASDLYFLSSDGLYFSKDMHGIGELFSLLYPMWYTRRQWYCYSLSNGSVTKIFQPTNQTILLGRLQF
jgi:hypothetical protein